MGASHSDSDSRTLGGCDCEVTEMSEAVCVSVLQLQEVGLDGPTALLLSAGAREGKNSGRGRAFLCPHAAPVPQGQEGQLPPLPPWLRRLW